MEEKQPDLQAQILNERLMWAVRYVKDLAKENGIAFDKEVFLTAIETGRLLFTRKEMAYSGAKK